MKVEEDRATNVADGAVSVRIVDTDVHPVPRSTEELRTYLQGRWKDVPEEMLGSHSLVLYLPPAHGTRADSDPPEGGPAGSSPELLEEQLIGAGGVDYPILMPLVRTHSNLDYESALCATTNDWLSDTWLSKYNTAGRYFGTLNVSASQPYAAAREIERWGGDPRFVQVRVNAYAGAPLGDPRFHPIYEVAAKHGLPVAVHFSKGSGLNLVTPAGFLSYFFEHHSLYPVNYAAHACSLIVNGVFDKFEGLRFVFAEGGFIWVLPMLWRLENMWDRYRSAEGLEAKRRPFDYLYENIRFTTQPLEEPKKRSELSWILKRMDAGRVLMFSSDYPHWDFDDPTKTIYRFPKEMREGILGGNALELYRLPKYRSADS